MKNFIILRREICDMCDRQKTTLGVKVCKECGCSIWAKTQLPAAVCPIGKWGKSDNAN